MKIFFASQSFYPYIGGVSTYLLNLSRGLLHRGHQVSEIHLRPPQEEGRSIIEGIDIYRVPKEPLNKEQLKGYSFFKECIYKECNGQERCFKKPVIETKGFNEYYEINETLGLQIAELLENNPVEIVHIHDFQLLFLHRFIPRGIPLILTWHIPFLESISPPLKEFLVKQLNKFDRIIFSSQDYIDAAKKAGVSSKKLKLIHPIIDRQLFTPQEDFDQNKVRGKYGFKKTDKIILCVQRIDPKSGHIQLIQALPQILKKEPRTKLVFVGGDSLSSKISDQRQKNVQAVKRMIKDLKLEKNVFFLGSIDYFNLPEVYQMVDVSALTSRMEGFGLALSEAMSMGKPVIGTNIGGIPLQIVDNKNGFLVEVDDIKTTAKRIIELLKDENKAFQFGKEARKTILSKFHPDRTIEKHIKLYQTLLNEKHEHEWWRSIKKDDIDALVIDFDRTLTDQNLEINPEISNALRKLDQKIIISTGRPFSFVRAMCKRFPFIHAAVAENGAIVYLPKEKKKIICVSEYQQIAREIFKENSVHADMGEVVISVKKSEEKEIKKMLKKVRKNLNFIYNVDELMILPKDTDKGSGVSLALHHLGIKPERVILFGDAENDIDLFNIAGLRVAVNNAHSRLKAIADIVTKKGYYKGVLEIIETLDLT